MSNQAVILLMVFELNIPFAHSLKSKRQLIKSITEKIKVRFNASVSEIDHQDKWQRATFGAVFISSQAKYLQKEFDALETFLRSQTEVEISNIEQHWI